jgi:hypothetical protein
MEGGPVERLQGHRRGHVEHLSGRIPGDHLRQHLLLPLLYRRGDPGRAQQADQQRDAGQGRSQIMLVLAGQYRPEQLAHHQHLTRQQNGPQDLQTDCRRQFSRARGPDHADRANDKGGELPDRPAIRRLHDLVDGLRPSLALRQGSIVTEQQMQAVAGSPRLRNPTRAS